MEFVSLRKSTKKTQEEVAKDLGIGRATYANYENGKTQPDYKTLVNIANYFNVSLDYLFSRQFNNNIGYIPDNVKEIVKKMLELDEVQLQKIDAYVTAQLDAKN